VYGNETKRQSYECVSEHSARPKELPFQKSRAKTTLIMFFDSQGTVHKQFVQEGCTVNAQYYKGVFDRTISSILPVRPALYFTRHSFLPHHNAPPPHSAARIGQFLTKTQVAKLHYPILAIVVSPTIYCSRRCSST
jgi:hypothetical protein